MDIKKIKNLAEILNSNHLTLLELCEGEDKVRLERAVSIPAGGNVNPVPNPAEPAMLVRKIPVAEQAAVDFNDMYEVKSPMVGVFYAAPAPDAKPFVQIGSKVKAGATLCIIEAMKLMNDIVADRDGGIIDICAENGKIVEFGQTLFKIY